MWTRRRLVDDAARGDRHGGDGPRWVIDGPHELLSDEFPYVGAVGLDITVLRREVGVAPVAVLNVFDEPILEDSLLRMPKVR